MIFVRQLFVLSLILVSSKIFGQIPKHLLAPVEEYSAKDFSITKRPVKDWVGVYHFGESESEWDFVIHQYGDSLIVQLYNGIWGLDQLNKKETWLSQCQTYNSAYTLGNRIFFGPYNGLFTEYKLGNKISKALLIFCDPIFGRRVFGKDSAEVGIYNSLLSIKEFYKSEDPQSYYQLSLSIQPDNFFKGKSKEELKIMRNTIYAKYGLLFQKGGDMENYFKGKSWYNPYLKDVSACLTEIEKRNILSIIRFEQM